MDKDKLEFSIGYRKPPQRTRFKPGQSGNPSGRRQRKAPTLQQAVAEELESPITVTEAGKMKRLTKQKAIAKQLINTALQGNYKAIALLMRAIESRQPNKTDELSPLLQTMRAIHAKHELDNSNATGKSSESALAGSEPVDINQVKNDPA